MCYINRKIFHFNVFSGFSKTDTRLNRFNVFFLGAGEFASPVLKALVEDSRVELVGIGTQPDKEAGRKRILTPCPLGQWADSNHIPCERVTSVNTDEFLNKVRALEPDIIIVVSFGQILKQPLLDLPKFGCLNVHASILPKYRGASPIAAAVLNGDEETGVTFMRMERGLDTGPIYAICRMQVPSGVTTEVLENKLAVMAGANIVGILDEVINMKKEPMIQPTEGVCLTKKISKQDASIDWNRDAVQIERSIRAYAKWPTMRFCMLNQGRMVQVKVLSASATEFGAGSANATPGSIISLPSDGSIYVQCKRGALVIREVLPEGKKAMQARAFINGTHLSVGDVFYNGPDAQIY